MTLRLTPVPEAQRGALDAMATAYYAEVLPDGPSYLPRMIDHYWIKQGRHPYLIQDGATPVGFALVWTHPDGTHELAEFTVLPAYRHKGLGREAAQLVFLALGGDWTLGVAASPPGAMMFWQRCLEDFGHAFDIVQGPPKTAHQSGSFSFRVGR